MNFALRISVTQAMLISAAYGGQPPKKSIQPQVQAAVVKTVSQAQKPQFAHDASRMVDMAGEVVILDKRDNSDLNVFQDPNLFHDVSLNYATYGSNTSPQPSSKTAAPNNSKSCNDACCCSIQ